MRYIRSKRLLSYSIHKNESGITILWKKLIEISICVIGREIKDCYDDFLISCEHKTINSVLLARIMRFFDCATFAVFAKLDIGRNRFKAFSFSPCV